MESSLRHTEIHLVVESLSRLYGYDFRHYSQASLGRRMRLLAERHAQGNVGELLKRILYEPDLLPHLLSDLTVTTTEMFRDPWIFSFLRAEVFPVLATYPSIRVWHAGCGTGEEAYSLAILLHEGGLLPRTTIFATDINPAALRAAREGIFPLARLAAYTENYYNSGGRNSFSEYYQAGASGVLLDSRFREKIVFCEHNLFSDDVFSETHLVFCRNVMIYFDAVAQRRALRLFSHSLVRSGFLVLGSAESLGCSASRSEFSEMEKGLRVFQKTERPPGGLVGHLQLP